ncbi:MAG TPA: hypothetical protein VKA49_20660, partial [Flavitalea sp.]|nr:hypothetical protein [Flavitalea sp.]
GRAGRRDGRGEVLVQVANTRHPVLQYVQQHDYKLFFKNELEDRKRFLYPPFSRILLLTFRHKIKEVVHAAAYRFAEALKRDFGQYLVGPAEPVVNRVRNQFLMELLVKLPKDGSLIAACKAAVHEQIAVLHNEKKFRSVVMIPDVDAM